MAGAFGRRPRIRLLPTYRYIDSADDEGPEFLRVLEEITRFYVNDMNGRMRPDAPGARIKFTRDWEYPWTFLRAEAGPGSRLLDCGAGNSPLPFLWAQRGVDTWALDRDALVASRGRYAMWCAEQLVTDIAKDLGRVRTAGPLDPPFKPGPKGPGLRGAHPAPGNRLSRFFRYHWRRNSERLRRLQKPDFWGPVSPQLLRRFGVHYVRGDLTSLPFPTAGFDVVSSISVLEHMPEPARVRGLSEMARVLRPGGRLLVTYDLIDGDITDRLIAASGCAPLELVYLKASGRLYAPNAPDVVGMVLRK